MRFVILFVFVLLAFGCIQQSDPLPPEQVYLEYNTNGFSFQYPDWPDASDDIKSESFLVKTNSTCIFGASEYPVPSKMLMETLENHFNAEFNGDIIDYVMDAGDTQITAHTKIVYCNYVSYALTYSCADDTVGNIIFDLTFANTA